MTATVYLVRHGATDWSEAGRFQGQTDVPLNGRGRGEAGEAAERLAAAAVSPAAVYSSDLARAAETARIIAARLGAPPTRWDPRLRERCWGLAEGLTRAEFQHRFRRSPSAVGEMIGAEPQAAAVARFDAVLEELATQHQGRAVVVVSHGAVMGSWLRARVESFHQRHPDGLAHGEIITIRRDDDGWRYLP